MPLTSAAKKANSRSIKLRERNYTVKSTMKSTLKKVNKMSVSGEKLLSSHIQDSYSKIDRALKVGILHKNTAARRKSKIAKLVKNSI